MASVVTLAEAERRLPRQKLRERVLKEAENRPGVYRFTGPRGEVLYVGKSVQVRSRLLSYFRSSVPSKQSGLLRVAAGVEWEYVPNEFEALLRELRLIRAFRPRFNRRHRGERRFAWIRFSGSAAPRLVATRRPNPSGGTHFGPFPAPSHLPRLLRDLSVSVGLRDCPDHTPIHYADQEDLFAPAHSPGCPRAELGTCPAPCASRCSFAQYQERVEEARRFLDGETDAPLTRLVSRIAEAADSKEYEIAASLRDREARLRTLRDEVVLFRDFLAGLTFLYRVPSEPDGPDTGYVVSEGRVLSSFRIPPDPESRGFLQDRIRSILTDRFLPPVHDQAESREEVFLVVRWFRWNPEERMRTVPFEEILAAPGPGHPAAR